MPHVKGPAVLLLSLAAGLSDAFAFLLLGGIFTANMTGNVVLSALFTHPAYVRVLAGSVGAVASFALGAYMTFRRWGRGAREHGRQVRASLRPALLVELGVALLWTMARSAHPAGDSGTWAGWVHGAGDVVRALIVMANAYVMGVQSAVMKRSVHGGVVTTTYVTGTIVGLMDDLSRGRPGLLRRTASIAMLVLGALIGCALTACDERLAPWGCVAALWAAFLITGARPVAPTLTDRPHSGAVRGRRRPGHRP